MAVASARHSFEHYWGLGIPLTKVVDNGEEPSPETTTLLMLLSAGPTDAHIARGPGISPRTLARRITDLQDRLAARGRFQLAVQAARRGWLPGPPIGSEAYAIRAETHRGPPRKGAGRGGFEE